MLRSLLIGLVAGSRSITPLAAVSDGIRRGAVTQLNPQLGWLGHPLISSGLGLLAGGELLGDKWTKAPDRIVAAGILARLVAGGLAGAALARNDRTLAGGILGAGAAVAAAYLSFALRRRAMVRFGQTPTGLVEDALTVAAARRIVAS